MVEINNFIHKRLENYNYKTGDLVRGQYWMKTDTVDV